MKIENLEKQYPELFTNCYCGVGCGDGWYDLLNNLCSTISTICKENNVKVNVAQIKEKFGTLRFYCDVESKNKEISDRIFNLVDDAEKCSSTICEECGAKAEEGSTKTGWIKVLCPKCMEERNKNY